MAHQISNPPDIYEIIRIVPNEENKTSNEGTNNSSNGSHIKTHGSNPGSLEIGLEL